MNLSHARFVGGKNMRIWNTSTPWVSCDDCLANTAYGDTKEEAIEQWNRRADKLEGQPTAYDVDKVVVNLEKQRDVWNDKEVADKKLVEEKRKAYNMAIKIVKGGEVK